MPQAFDLLAFDWDGTLIDSTAHIAQSLQGAARDLGLDVPTDAAASHVIGLGLAQAFACLWPDLPEARQSEVLARYRFHFFAGDEAVALFPGVPAMLQRLRAQGYRLAVATGKARAGLVRALGQTGLAELFDATRCADETASKPDPLMLLELMEELEVAPGRVLMIGDTTHDLEMALHAGCPAVAVRCGAHPEAALRGVPHLAMLDVVTELEDWLACRSN